MDASLNEKLSQVKWGEFRLGDLFDVISYKKRFDANKVDIKKNGKYPYVVRTSSNNGQRGFIVEDESFLNEGNTISFGQDTATMFYQEIPYFTGDKIKILKAKDKRFNKKNAQFFLSTMVNSFSSFSWGGSRFNVDIIKNQNVSLPYKNGEIDFDFMETFIEELEAERITDLSIYLKVSGLDDYRLTGEEEQSLNRFQTLEWKLYKIGELFEKLSTKKLPYKAKDLPDRVTDNYVLPCLTSSFKNQGLNYYAPKENATILKNVISIPSNSDVYKAYYQSREFTVLSDAYAIDWKFDRAELTNYQYLFMVMCINKVTDLPKYSYKMKLGGWNVVKNIDIALPVQNGKIDLSFMDNFINAISKSTIQDVVKYVDKKTDISKPTIQK
ncbi:restriction endonuclease [Listeria booriae]|uniref:restriction endonuclease subunit S n=1 Tax=Listeria booriae TaxID=1552123 RepID=UPI001627DC4A|nr:restriction endonuclease subunit S [Listeria booriae]MBC1525274.1 restriction endonuclease [Listeria booriae]